MVLFFSATGNTRFIAKQLAKRLDDECIDLLDRIKTKDHSGFYSKKPYVICAPIYVCEPPIFLMKYLKKVKLSGNPNVYFVFTSGGYSGIAGRMAHQLMFFKKMNCMGHADVVMPRNYVASDMRGEQETDPGGGKAVRKDRISDPEASEASCETCVFI